MEVTIYLLEKGDEKQRVYHISLEVNPGQKPLDAFNLTSYAESYYPIAWEPTDAWINHQHNSGLSGFDFTRWRAETLLGYWPPKLISDSIANAVEVPQGQRKPPRAVLVQTFVEEIERDNPGELARRAWEATQIAGKGSLT